MGDLKPIGSEKLQGQDKLRRIMEIARFNETIPSVINETAKTEYTRTLADGNNYEIVKERQGYILKRTITESGTDYMEPMKNRKYYSSYSQALKRLNLVAGELNRVNENETEVSMFGEQKKFTLKTPKPAPVPMEAAAPPMAPPAVPLPELPASPTSDAGMGDDLNLDVDSEEMGPEGDIDVSDDINIEEPSGDEEEQVTFKTIQKLTGKLTQKIRTLENEEGMTSEDIKYVINMVISSLDLGSLSEEDKEDIVDKFEENSENLEGDDMGGDDMDGEDLTDDSEVEDIQADMDIPMEGEMDEDMYGSFGNMSRKDYKGDTYYDENDRQSKDSDLYGIGGDDFDTEEFDTFQKLNDKYGDKHKWFGRGEQGEKIFNAYKEKTGNPFKVKTRKSEMDEDMYGSFGNMSRKDYKGDKYYDENDRMVKDKDIYGIGGDDFDTEEFDTFQKLNDKYGDKHKWFGRGERGEKMFNAYKEKTGNPFKVKTRKSEMDDFGNGAIVDSIFGESKVDKVLSKYFEVSKKELVENRERVANKNLTKISDVRKKMGEVVKLTETIEQELASQKYLQKNSSAKIVGKTNKNNLVFENKGVQVRITPEGQIL